MILIGISNEIVYTSVDLRVMETKERRCPMRRYGRSIREANMGKE